MLIQSGVGFIVLGALIAGSKIDKKLKKRLKESPYLQPVIGNLGLLFFVIGVLLLLVGVADLYY